MTSSCKNILLSLLVCALPSQVIATETVPLANNQKTSDLSKSAPATDAALSQKATESLKTPQQIRLGYADIVRIGAESILGKASQAQAKEKQQKFQAQLESRGKQLEKQKAAIEAKLAKLTPAQREAKAREFQKKVEEFQKFGQSAEKELQTMQEGLSKALFEEIELAAVEYGKANGLALVIVKRELLYLAGGVDAQDVSDGIIKLMNEHGQKK